MKTIISLCVAYLFLIMTACATSNYSVGNDFPSNNVSKIEKGKTTTMELIRLFGDPFSKTVISSTSEKWIYTYSAGTATAQSYLVKTKVEAKGIQKTLDILIENGVVSNYTFTEGPGPNTSVK
ncbi:MAG: hypothetical protein AB2598_20350 [Candidatus Thiodiazotropha sp.]